MVCGLLGCGTFCCFTLIFYCTLFFFVSFPAFFCIVSYAWPYLPTNTNVFTYSHAVCNQSRQHMIGGLAGVVGDTMAASRAPSFLSIIKEWQELFFMLPFSLNEQNRAAAAVFLQLCRFHRSCFSVHPANSSLLHSSAQYTTIVAGSLTYYIYIIVLFSM